jgi:glycosyltransferase involved in cell wall biosynthesis
MNIKKYFKIICICQVYNELEKGNLKRFYKHIKSVADAIVIYDDGSTDGSFEYSLKQTPYVIRGSKNDFKSEISHRQLMLQKALELSPDFILWLDADEVLCALASEKLQEVCQEWACRQSNL